MPILPRWLPQNTSLIVVLFLKFSNAYKDVATAQYLKLIHFFTHTFAPCLCRYVSRSCGHEKKLGIFGKGTFGYIWEFHKNRAKEF